MTDEHTGHCVLCTPAAHGNRDEYTTASVEIEALGTELDGEVRVCRPHYKVIRRVLIIESDEFEYPDDDPTTALPDGGTVGGGSACDELLDWAGEAVRGKLCEVSGCQHNPVAERNGRKLCGKHRDHYDHATMGKPCDKCGSRQWVKTPDAASVAVCALCDYVTYDEDILAGSWSDDTVADTDGGEDSGGS